MNDVAIVQLRQAGSGSEDARLQFSANNEKWSGGAMVCATAGIFLNPAAKFTEAHQKDTIKIALGLQIRAKSGERGVKFRHEPFMRADLVAVRVVAALGHIVNPRGHSPADESGDEIERVRKPVRRIGSSWPGALDDLGHLVGAHD